MRSNNGFVAIDTISHTILISPGIKGCGTKKKKATNHENETGYKNKIAGNRVI